MIFVDVFDEEICDAQGEVFEEAAKSNFDMNKFTNDYLNSDFCLREIDSDYSVFQLEWLSTILVVSDVEPRIDDTCETCWEPAVGYWVGYMYRYLHYLTLLNSREIIKNIPVEVMCDHYEAYHTTSYEYAGDLLKEKYLLSA